MKNRQAVIFDMDGVLVDSERLWSQAEKEIFTSLGGSVTEEYAVITKAMTTAAVTKFWYDKFPWQDTALAVVEDQVVSRVIDLIVQEDCLIQGVGAFVEKLKSKDYKVGLATNAPYRMIPTVLEKLGITQLFDAVSSTEFEAAGKPDPAIYLTVAKRLGVAPHNCIVIEDSYSGMLAAKRAGMRVIAFTNGSTRPDPQLADGHIDNFENATPDLLNKSANTR